MTMAPRRAINPGATRMSAVTNSKPNVRLTPSALPLGVSYQWVTRAACARGNIRRSLGDARRWRLSRARFVAIPGSKWTRFTLRSRAGPAFRLVAHVGKLREFLDENLRQLIDSVAYHCVAGTREGGRAMCDVVDRRAHSGCAFNREQPRNCNRRGDLSRQTLHKNCPNRRRLQAFCETSDGFRFHSGATAHVSAI